MNIHKLFEGLPNKPNEESINLQELEAHQKELERSIRTQERMLDAFSQSPDVYKRQTKTYDEMIEKRKKLKALYQESKAELDALERIKELRILLSTIIDEQASPSKKYASLIEARGHIDRIQKAGEKYRENSILSKLYSKMPHFSLFLDQYQEKIIQAYNDLEAQKKTRIKIKL